MTDVEWEIEIKHDGIWPTPWMWHVSGTRRSPWDYNSRFGFATTKDRARRKAIKAKRSMETEDVKVTM